jgi:hypothetical protein
VTKLAPNCPRFVTIFDQLKDCRNTAP